MTATAERIPTTALAGAAPLSQRSPLTDAVRKLRRHRSFQLGFALLSLLVLVAIFADVLAPFDPIRPLSGVKRRDTPCI
ncbi:MAG: hypothetical protein LC737_11205, partial [Chloroflexi bacterium]|nr:hypothetical protein [Chloroflexota bacterium]